MPQYRLELTWTEHGRNNPVSVHDRRQAAVGVAGVHHVTGPGGDDIRNHITEGQNGPTWIVEGSKSNVYNMIEEWKIHENVHVSGGPPGP